MPTLSGDQLKALSAGASEAFAQRLFEFIVARWSEKATEVGEEKLRQVITSGISKAGGWGITIQADVAHFVILQLSLGEDFDTREPFAGALASFEGDGEEKIVLLIALAHEELETAPEE